MQRTLGLVAIVTGLLLTGPTSTEAAEGRRALLASERPGSMVLPRPLAREALADMCRGIEAAMDPIYVANVPGRAFRLGTYDAGAGVLPIQLNRALAAMDGAALLSTEERDVAFELEKKDADTILAGHEQRLLGLEVTFQLDDATTLPSCFSAPRSDQWTLHVEALTFSIVDAKGTKLATVRTKAMRRLEAWVRPGTARVRIEARARDGLVDDERATVALGSVRPSIESCTKPIVDGVADPVSLAYVAKVNTRGAIGEVRPELYTADLDDALACVAKALAAAELSAAPSPYELSIVVAIDRPGFDVEM